MADANVDSLEKHRQRLEESLEKLRKALKHWQVYSAEYEGLQEELLALPEDADRQTMLEIAKDFGGSVVTEKEITSFLGDKEGIKRSPQQAADAVRRRIDYVQKNAEAVQRQLDHGENRLSALKVVSRPDQVTNEEGLPIMNIKEELDEDGNVINSSATEEKPEAVPMNLKDIKGFEKYANDKQKIMEVEDDDDEEEHIDPKKAQQELNESIEKLNYLAKEVRATGQDPKTFLKNNMEASMPTQPPKGQEAKSSPTPAKKAEAKAVPPAKKPKRKSDREQNKTVSEDEVPQPATIKVIDDLPNDFSNAPEVDESKEDARLRQEMIRYNLGEVGAIVAELELEEDNDDENWEDDLEEDYNDDDDEEEEDEYGRSTRQFITDDLRAEMEALQRKLLGDGAAKRQEAIKIANEKEAEERRQVEEKTKEAKEEKPKKGVRFAETMDISPAAEIPPTTAESPPTPSILDMVFGPGTKDADAKQYNPTAEAPKPKGPSLFKMSRQAAGGGSVTAETTEEAPLTQKQPLPNANRPPIGDIAERPSSNATVRKAPSWDSPENEDTKDDNDQVSPPQPLLSNTIMERPPTTAGAKKPAAPSLETDELDPELHMQEVTMAHFQMRNKLIQRQGGFIERDEEKAIVPIDENGEPVKVSRFKAARVRNEL